MRRKDKEITDNTIIQEILVKSNICRLGLVDNGEAYIVPVNYAYENGIIYFHSALSGRKIEIFKKNNVVSFEIEFTGEIIKNSIPCEWSAKYRSVMGRGSVSFENDLIAKKKGLDLIMQKYGVESPLIYDQSALSKMVIIMLKIDSLTCKQSGTW
jgi:uncharacterized protein